MSKPAPQPSHDDMTFEDAMQRLDQIVGDMESDRLPLEDMITGYEEGIALLKVCRQRLEKARRRVELITADVDAGKASLAPFDDDEGEEAGDGESSAAATVRQSPPKRRKASDGDEIRLF